MTRGQLMLPFAGVPSVAPLASCREQSPSTTTTDRRLRRGQFMLPARPSYELSHMQLRPDANCRTNNRYRSPVTTASNAPASSRQTRSTAASDPHIGGHASPLFERVDSVLAA